MQSQFLVGLTNKESRNLLLVMYPESFHQCYKMAFHLDDNMMERSQLESSLKDLLKVSQSLIMSKCNTKEGTPIIKG